MKSYVAMMRPEEISGIHSQVIHREEFSNQSLGGLMHLGNLNKIRNILRTLPRLFYAFSCFRRQLLFIFIKAVVFNGF